MSCAASSSTIPATASDTAESVVRRLLALSVGVFFIGGFLSASVSLLVPQLKSVLALDYGKVLLVQFAFHASYLLFALPAALAVVRIGYMRAIASGLAVMAAGCLALAAAQGLRDFALILGALLLLSSGQTVLQIASNTVVTVIGPSRRSAFRLNLLQGFNSLGTVLGPLVSAPFLLADVHRGEGRDTAAALPFVATGAVLAVLAVVYLRHRRLLAREDAGGGTRADNRLRRILAVLRDRRLCWGIFAIFVYVGAEVTVGTLMTNVLMLPERLGLSPVSAGRLVSFYWAGAMAGRFAGAWLMTRIAEARLLLVAAVAAGVLAAAAAGLPGAAGAAALIAIGLCNAIMYPTIYALAMPADAADAPLASMWLCMAVVGGAIVPLLTGAAADAIGLLPALLLPALCYAGVALFAAMCLRPGKMSA
ncbi:MFS transporter [Novosphingobium sp. KA1]|uniref:MFS transporter n=1 Tax=Novosphingobium sp. (strain KA1) TaxID=164608 RepID=UPI001A8E1F17|nr:MFS transporter [Novosphingobium sp. KA1]QSR20038.1 MFS transporter [Novosphingobium sp. KA1]